MNGCSWIQVVLTSEWDSWFLCGPSLEMATPPSASQTGRENTNNVISILIYVTFTLSQYVFFSSLPLVPRTTTSRRCGCVPACSRPLVPCTPQCHRRNKLSSHDQWLLYTGRNLKTHKTLTKDPDHTHYYSSTITATKSFNMKQFSHKSSVKATS